MALLPRHWLACSQYVTIGSIVQRFPRTVGEEWEPGRVGEGWLLRNVVKMLRRKLRDSAANPRYILTEPRVAYRLVVGEGEEI